ncbi:MAG: hypothetical protein PHZ26_05035 [Candidatus Gracilibacteria bacterium]|nr:hypothetical protein [Candidatus Gracilibacteria bacterium]MDD2909082.1 hypothetical protein [Candidatus Gracilibacteria bacterium]
MSEAKKFDGEESNKKKIINNIKPVENAGIFKEKDKLDLESRIVDTLKKLNGKLTKKEIMELFHRVEVGKGLDGLKKELEKEVKLGGKEISDEVLKAILDLIKESTELAHKGIEELKLELNKLNISKIYDIDKKVYFSNKYPWIKKLENSELGENILKDIAGIGVGVSDSAVAIFKLLLELVKDLIMLPRDLIKGGKK